MNDQPVTIPTCCLCAQQHRGPRPMHQTASGVWVCPICDRNIPHQPTPAQARHAKEQP